VLQATVCSFFRSKRNRAQLSPNAVAAPCSMELRSFAGCYAKQLLVPLQFQCTFTAVRLPCHAWSHRCVAMHHSFFSHQLIHAAPQSLTHSSLCSDHTCLAIHNRVPVSHQLNHPPFRSLPHPPCLLGGAGGRWRLCFHLTR
jgi:hypothetical protein